MSRIPTPEVLVVPESAQRKLVHVHEQLRFLTRATEAENSASAFDNLFRDQSLSWWFTRLARDLDEILEEIDRENGLAVRQAQ